MFKDRIYQTCFTDEASESYFNDKVVLSNDYITVSNYEWDSSFMETLRAIIGKRLKEDEGLVLLRNIVGISRNARNIAEGITSWQPYINGNIVNKNYRILQLVYLNNTSNDNPDADVLMDNLRNEIPSVWESAGRPGTMELSQKVSLFFRNQTRIDCYVNDCRTILVMKTIPSLSLLHYIQCGIPVFLPNMFKEEDGNGITEKEMNLIKSLRQKTSAEYIKALKAIAEDYNFREMNIRARLAGYEQRKYIRQKEETVTKIQNILNDIESYKRSIEELLNSKDDKETVLAGLNARIAEMENGEDGQSDVMDYFLSHKNIDLVSTTDDRITYIIRDYCMEFDPDEAERAINSYNSELYNRYNSPISNEHLKKLYTYVFLKEKIKLRFCAKFSVSSIGRIEAISHEQYTDAYDSYMPNPHINGYRCLGNNRQILEQWERAGDMLGSVEQTYMAERCLSFHDSTVMGEFRNYICNPVDYHVNNRAFELPNGEVVTPIQAIEWILNYEKEQEQGEVNNE